MHSFLQLQHYTSEGGAPFASFLLLPALLLLLYEAFQYAHLQKTLVAVISTITGIDAEFLGVPSLAYKIGDYAVDKDGTVTGPASKELVEALEAKGFTSKNEEGENDHE